MKTCSKTLFKKWIDDVKRAYSRIPEIKDKIAYYESQLNGYHAVTYDSVRVNTFGNSQERKMLLSIERIQNYNSQLKKEESVIESYYRMKKMLDCTSTDILNYLILSYKKPNEICVLMSISRSRYYSCIESIKEKFTLNEKLNPNDCLSKK